MWNGRRALVAAVLVAEAIVIGGVVAAEFASRRAEEARISFKLRPGTVWRDNPAMPIRDPRVVEAASAEIKPEALVVGVEMNGRARAYLLEALEDPRRHLVSDNIDGVPLTVAYCNLGQCVRVFSRPKGARPIDIEVVGLLNQQMVIKVDGNLYLQSTGEPVEPEKDATPMSCDSRTPVVTTWKAWTDLHPGTDVYEGEAGSAAE